MVSGSRVSKAYLDLGSFRRAAPRAVGSRSRVGLLARPSAAVSGDGRLRGSFVAACLPLCFWVPHPPGRLGDPQRSDAWGDGVGHAWLALERSANKALAPVTH